INNINNLVEKYKNKDFAYSMIIEYMYVGPEAFKRARDLNKLVENVDALRESGELDAEIEKHKKGAEAFHKDYDSRIDKEIFRLLTAEFIAQMGDEAPAYIKSKSPEQWADDIYEKSVLVDKDRYVKFVSKLGINPLNNVDKKDPVYVF